MILYKVIALIVAAFRGIDARSSSFLRHGKKQHGKLGQQQEANTLCLVTWGQMEHPPKIKSEIIMLKSEIDMQTFCRSVGCDPIAKG